MQVTIKNGQLVVRIPMLDPPRPSATGKNLTVATTSGNMVTTLMIEGKPVKLGLNAYIAKD